MLHCHVMRDPRRRSHLRHSGHQRPEGNAHRNHRYVLLRPLVISVAVVPKICTTQAQTTATDACHVHLIGVTDSLHTAATAVANVRAVSAPPLGSRGPAPSGSAAEHTASAAAAAADPIPAVYLTYPTDPDAERMCHASVMSSSNRARSTRSSRTITRAVFA